MKSSHPKDKVAPPPSEGGRRHPELDYRGESRSKENHNSTTNPDAMRAGKRVEDVIVWVKTNAGGLKPRY